MRTLLCFIALASCCLGQGLRNPAFVASQNVVAASESPPAWSPTNVASLLIWHKADSGVYDYTPVTPPGTDNAPVSKWDDLSGNAIHLYNETGSGGSPKWVTNAWNGKPVVRFTAASSHVLTNSFTNLTGTDLPATFAFVCSVVATNTTATLFRNFKGATRTTSF